MKGQEQSQSQDQTHTSLSNMTIKTFICIDKKCGIIQVDTPNLSIKYYVDFPDYNGILSNNKNLFMNTLSSKFECIKFMKISDKTINKILDKAMFYKSYYYRTVEPKIAVIIPYNYNIIILRYYPVLL